MRAMKICAVDIDLARHLRELEEQDARAEAIEAIKEELFEWHKARIAADPEIISDLVGGSREAIELEDRVRFARLHRTLTAELDKRWVECIQRLIDEEAQRIAEEEAPHEYESRAKEWDGAFV